MNDYKKILKYLIKEQQSLWRWMYNQYEGVNKRKNDICITVQPQFFEKAEKTQDNAVKNRMTTFMFS